MGVQVEDLALRSGPSAVPPAPVTPGQGLPPRFRDVSLGQFAQMLLNRERMVRGARTAQDTEIAVVIPIQVTGTTQLFEEWQKGQSVLLGDECRGTTMPQPQLWSRLRLDAGIQREQHIQQRLIDT